MPLLQPLRQRLHHARVKLSGMRPREGDLFDEKVGQDIHEIAVPAGIELWHIPELGLVVAVAGGAAVAAPDGQLEVQG
jgi:hypothetical protein